VGMEIPQWVLYMINKYCAESKVINYKMRVIWIIVLSTVMVASSEGATSL